MKDTIVESLIHAQLIVEEVMSYGDKIAQIASVCIRAFQNNGKMIFAGNGGSMCDAMHCAQELVGFFKEKRRALPAIALAEPGFLTCVANDTSFDEVFSRGVEAYGAEGDVFVGLSTSGNSKNICVALTQAHHQGLTTIALLGKGGGKAKGIADFEIILSSVADTARIQEGHMLIAHVLFDLIEKSLFCLI